VSRDCEPHNPQTGCACALICGRCGACLIHCTCPAPDQRAKDPGRLAQMLRHLVNTRRVHIGRER
jgi:hypothetical protein